MADKLPLELWIKIFQNLTPVDLCFSISLVNKNFYEISQDNEIWSLFKCESWNDNARLKSEKKKFRFFRNTPNKSKIYKELYIDWIRKIGRIARQSNIIPQWEIKTNGKKNIRLMVVGNIVIKECKPLYTPLLENRNTTTKQDGTVVVFSDSTKTISIGQDSIFDQRGSPEYYIEDLVRMSNGILFLC